MKTYHLGLCAIERSNSRETCKIFITRHRCHFVLYFDTISNNYLNIYFQDMKTTFMDLLSEILGDRFTTATEENLHLLYDFVLTEGKKCIS